MVPANQKNFVRGSGPRPPRHQPLCCCASSSPAPTLVLLRLGSPQHPPFTIRGAEPRTPGPPLYCSWRWASPTRHPPLWCWASASRGTHLLGSVALSLGPLVPLLLFGVLRLPPGTNPSRSVVLSLASPQNAGRKGSSHGPGQVAGSADAVSSASSGEPSGHWGRCAAPPHRLALTRSQATIRLRALDAGPWSGPVAPLPKKSSRRKETAGLFTN